MTKSFAVLAVLTVLVCLAVSAEGPAPAAPESAVTVGPPAAARPVLIGQQARLSYSIGFSIGSDLKNQKIGVNPDILIQGIVDALTNVPNPLLSEQEVAETIQAFQKEQMAKAADKQREFADKNLQAGEAFLAENANKSEVTVLPSGLQYVVETEGDGDTPKLTDRVTINYRGTLIDGTEFDSSYKRGVPATFFVNGVIPGFSEALQLMKVGSKWKVFVPAKLGYGERGAPGSPIAPNSVLIFELELLAIEKSGM